FKNTRKNEEPGLAQNKIDSPKRKFLGSKRRFLSPKRKFLSSKRRFTIKGLLTPISLILGC
ncbi:MAG: hypothetical protein LBF22_11885, partial [Deltaproteobacteria bacterium]|nr:hypothetical protein [Deltaproteobacteria bacterium]